MRMKMNSMLKNSTPILREADFLTHIVRIYSSRLIYPLNEMHVSIKNTSSSYSLTSVSLLITTTKKSNSNTPLSLEESLEQFRHIPVVIQSLLNRVTKRREVVTTEFSLSPRSNLVANL